MKKGLVIVIALVAVIVLVFSWYVGTRNSFVTLKENVEMQYSQIETALQRRNDLIPNLVATVQGYADHEEEVFTAVAEARAKLAGGLASGNIGEISEASTALDSALGRLLAISESYPELKANENFRALQDELAGTENRISVARQYYNEAVKSYNTTIQRFPASLIAGSSGYYPVPYFEASASAHEVPSVNFN